jgi:hypothetical protein
MNRWEIQEAILFGLVLGFMVIAAATLISAWLSYA